MATKSEKLIYSNTPYYLLMESYSSESITIWTSFHTTAWHVSYRNANISKKRFPSAFDMGWTDKPSELRCCLWINNSAIPQERSAVHCTGGCYIMRKYLQSDFTKKKKKQTIAS